MENNTKELLNKEYGLELMGCVLDELAKIPGFERVAIIKHAHELLTKECKNEAAALLSSEGDGAVYTALRNKLDALLPGKKERLVEILEIENISAQLSGG
jgi:hypothetical protein